MTTQISTIQVRRGLQAELPGLMSNGLAIAEVAFTTDTNRVFIGSDPSTANSVSFAHTTKSQLAGGFPYTNVEILTEFSPTNQIIFDYAAKNIQTAFITSAPLAITGNVWATLMVRTSTTTQIPFILDAQNTIGLYGSADISYHIIDFTSGAPIKTGRLRVLYQGNAFQPSVSDDSVCNEFAGFTNAGNALDPNEKYGIVEFKAVPTSDGLSIQYQINISGSNLPSPIMYFRVEQPFVSKTYISPAFCYLANSALVATDVPSLAVTGDVSGNSISNTLVLTLANINSNVGIYSNPIISVNEKGLITSVLSRPDNYPISTIITNRIISNSQANTIAVIATDGIIVLNKSSGSPTTITLETSPISGAYHIIKDGKGDAVINNITIFAANGGYIDGSLSYTINGNFDSVTLLYNGTQWNAI